MGKGKKASALEHMFVPNRSLMGVTLLDLSVFAI